MDLVVSSVEALGERVKRYTLQTPDRAKLPAFSAGAHLSITDCELSSRPEPRRYSLMNFGLASPDYYEIAILRQENGLFSNHAHRAWKIGTRLQVKEPRNDFEMHQGPGKRFFIGGGIGITPILGMARQAHRLGEEFESIYICRSRENAVFVEDLMRASSGRARLCLTEASVAANAIESFLKHAGRADHVYVCGPNGLMEAVAKAAADHGIGALQFHRELFAPVLGTNQPFDIFLQRSGKTVRVEATRSMLEALMDADVEIGFDCRVGTCGTCMVRVMHGALEHRDTVLLPEDRAKGNVACACVSRAAGERLILDL